MKRKRQRLIGAVVLGTMLFFPALVLAQGGTGRQSPNTGVKSGPSRPATKKSSSADSAREEAAGKYYGAGGAHFGAGRYAEAEAEYRRAIELMPRVDYFHRALATALQRQKKWSQVESECRIAIELNDKAYGSYQCLGESLLYQEKYDDAGVAYRAALRVFSESEDSSKGFIRAVIYQSIGINFYKQSRFSEAEEAFQKALEYDLAYTYAQPSDHFWLATVYKAQNKLQQAEREYRKALEGDPQHEYARRGLDEVLRMQGKQP